MRESRRIWIQAVALTLIGLLWLVRGLITDDLAITIVGLSLVLGVASFALINYIISNLRVKRYTKVAFLVASLGVIIFGYNLSGALILMIFTVLIIAVNGTKIAEIDDLSSFLEEYTVPEIWLKSQ